MSRGRSAWALALAGALAAPPSAWADEGTGEGEATPDAPAKTHAPEEAPARGEDAPPETTPGSDEEDPTSADQGGMEGAEGAEARGAEEGAAGEAEPELRPAPSDAEASSSEDEAHAEEPRGHLAPEVIQATIRDRFDAFAECYGEVLREQPELRAKTVSRITIDRDGATRDVRTRVARTEPAEIEPALSERLRSCVERTLATIVFPPPSGGELTLSHPIVFTPDTVAPRPGRPWLRIVADREGVMLRTATPSPDPIVCRAPCDQAVDLRPHERVFFAGDGITESPTYDLRAARGAVLAQVDTGSAGLWTAGVVTTTIGAAGAATGAVLTALGYGDVVEGSTLRTAGPVTLLVGVLGVAFGVGAMSAGTTSVVWKRDGKTVELSTRSATIRF